MEKVVKLRKLSRTTYDSGMDCCAVRYVKNFGTASENLPEIKLDIEQAIESCHQDNRSILMATTNKNQQFVEETLESFGFVTDGFAIRPKSSGGRVKLWRLYVGGIE